MHDEERCRPNAKAHTTVAGKMHCKIRVETLMPGLKAPELSVPEGHADTHETQLQASHDC